jgi:hypothetical protein
MNSHQRVFGFSRQIVLSAAWLAAAFLLLLAGRVAPARAALLCKQWRVGPYFRAVQDNGYIVLFQLRQSDRGSLSGRATYVSRGKTVRGVVYGGIGNTTFKVRVEWENNTIGNYIGSPWFVKPMGNGLSANMHGNTFPEGGGANSGWRTNAAAGEAQPIHCDPADTIRQ